MMNKIFIAACFFLLIGLGAQAQCDQCVIKDTPTPDYCYFNKDIQGLCAQFNQNGPYIYLKSGKKTVKKVPILETNDLLYFVRLTYDKKLNLSALEILFLREAMASWLIEKRKLGFEFAENGLGIKIKEKGTGALPEKGQMVKVHYTGYLVDGSKFDSSYDRNTPFSFPLGQGRVIKGWDEGVAKLPIGTKATLYIPAALGYGSRNAGTIPPNSDLIFEIELLGIEE